MNDKPALKAVPSPTLSPTDILRIAREECGVWFELGFGKNQISGFELFKSFMETLSTLGESTQKDGVHRAIEQFYESCLNLNVSSGTNKTPDDEILSAEISAREKWLGKMAETQSEVEIEIEKADTLVKNTSKDIRFSGNSSANLIAQKVTAEARKSELEEYSRELVTLREQVKIELETLRQLKRALDLVAKGCPRELMRKKLPKIPVLSEVGVADAVLPTPHKGKRGPVTTIVPDSMQEAPLPKKRVQLQALAESLELFDIEVFIYSLFDLFGTHGANLPGKGTRGHKRVLTVACEIGIASEYGWFGSTEDILIGSGWKDERVNESGFLIYCGSPSVGSSTYFRSDKPLPWNSRELFSEKAAAEFLNIMRNKSTQKKIRKKK